MMRSRVTAVQGLFGMAALGVWLTSSKRKQQTAPAAEEAVDLEPETPPSPLHAENVDIDDDSAAEIIRRAQPALERARKLG